MIHLILDGPDGMEAIHSQLALVLHFPDYYGRNLDALYDCLTEVQTDVCLELRHPDALGSKGPALAATLRDAAEENPHLHYD